MKTTLWVATRNAGKAREFAEMLGGDWEVRTLREAPELPEVVEDGVTFADNAQKKAVTISRLLAGLVLADDSGLEVDFLNGAPGVYSARYAGEPSDDARNNAKLLAALDGVPVERRGAHFRCVLALARDGEVVTMTEGICFGRILTEARGQAGFGYDPLFAPDHYEESFAELGAEIKHRISHRAKAMRSMAGYLKP